MSMREMHYTLLGDPIPLARTRLGRKHVWDSQKELKLITGINLVRQHDDQPLFAGPLHLDIIFFMHIPAKTKEPHNGKHHVFTPDLDNMIKWICDISISILFADDSIIASINAEKIYDKIPRTEFTLRELNG